MDHTCNPSTEKTEAATANKKRKEGGKERGREGEGEWEKTRKEKPFKLLPIT